MPSGLVAVVLGSDSDFPKMKECLATLGEMGVGHRVNIVSAHRSPQRAADFAAGAVDEGYDVIIAAAGGAAHLAGVIASWTTLPVIGVPLSGSAMGGVDALYSTVQMPPGVPVATVGIDAGRNAAILAVQILSLKYQSLREKLSNYKRRLAEGVAEKAARLEGELAAQAPLPQASPVQTVQVQPAIAKDEQGQTRRRGRRSGRRRKPNGQQPSMV